MSRSLSVLVVVLVAIAFALVLVAAPTAVAETSDVGRHVGDEVKSWSTSLLLAVAALLAIPILAKRDVGSGVALTLLVVLVGGFAFAPAAVRDVIESLWKSIAG